MKIKITIDRTFQGAWQLSTIVGDRYIHRQYMGYTKQEAISLFKEYIQDLTC